jgi:aminodeoxyfutalosine synthase
MSTVTAFDAYLDRINRGERLTGDEVLALSATPDILSLGMLADTVRRRLHETTATFLRVASVPFDGQEQLSALSAGREIRLTGSPSSLEAGAAAVGAAKSVAGDRTVAAFSWSDIERWSSGSSTGQVLARLKQAGLDALVDLPLDGMPDPRRAVDSLKDAGFAQLRLTIGRASVDIRTVLLIQASELQESSGLVQSFNPLPMALSAFRPTTGYEDVKMVALARLAVPNVPSIQVDWQRYGPKLAQVALTFGADDVDGVSASDEAPEGRRRTARAEIERNIEAAGLIPAERDGWFRRV